MSGLNSLNWFDDDDVLVVALDAMDKFDWVKTHKLMESVDWQYCHFGVPSIQRMKAVVLSLVNSCCKSLHESTEGINGSRWSSGGFAVYVGWSDIKGWEVDIKFTYDSSVSSCEFSDDVIKIRLANKAIETIKREFNV